MGRPRVTGENILVKPVDGDGINLDKMAVELERLNARGTYRGRPGEFAYNASRGGIIFNPYKL